LKWIWKKQWHGQLYPYSQSKSQQWNCVAELDINISQGIINNKKIYV
jgi:hypothetical protein